MATKTKARSTATYFREGHTWTAAELTSLVKAVAKAEKAGRSKRSAFEAFAEKMQAKDPSMTLTKVEARYNWHRRTLKGKAEMEALGLTPHQTVTSGNSTSTARSRPAVQKAAEALAKTASPAAIKPRNGKRSAPKAGSPLTLVGQLEAYVGELETSKATAEARAAAAEALVEELSSKLAKVHQLTA